MSFTTHATFSFGTSKAGLAAGVRVQPLTAAHAATGPALSATITEAGRGMYLFSGSVPDDTAFLRGYHTTDADVLDVVPARTVSSNPASSTTRNVTIVEGA